MRLLFSIFVLFNLSLPSQAQETEKSKIEQGLYYRVLVAVLAARGQDAKYAGGNHPLHRVIIMKNDQLNVGFPARIGDVEMEYLTADDLRARYRSLKYEITIFVMRPIVNEGDRLVIDFTRYWFSVAKGRNLMGLEGGYRVVLGYDCAQKDFVVESAKLWGI